METSFNQMQFIFSKIMVDTFFQTLCVQPQVKTIYPSWYQILESLKCSCSTIYSLYIDGNDAIN